MIDIDFIIQNKEIVEKAIKDRRTEKVDLDALIDLHSQRKKLIAVIDDINQKRKNEAKNYENKNHTQGVEYKKLGNSKEKELQEIMQKLISSLSVIPNIPLADVPIGKDESENKVIKEVGDKTVFNFTPLPHWEIGETRELLDSARASKVAGSRFTYIKGGLAHLQLALLQFVIDTVTDEKVLKTIIQDNNLTCSSKPFIFVIPPTMVLPKMLYGAGRLDPKEDKFFLEKDNLFLSGSAEHTLVTMHANEILNEEQLPLRYVGYSTAYRREAGSYGKDTRGILRQHQFDKAEMESFTTAEDGRGEQDFLVAIQEYVVQKLQLPYRVMAVCTGDMGTPDCRQIDIEIWMPGQNTYKETHSADYTSTYQSRRLKIRVKRKEGNELVHINDATLSAMGRMLIAIIENNQQKDGTITVPKVLQPYMNRTTI